MRRSVLGSLVVIAAFASPAWATMFNFPSGSLSGSGFGNDMELTVDGITVTATAWGLTDGGSPLTWEEGQLGDWSTGLGDCNQDEGTGCHSPLHTVDNAGQLDAVLFEFSETVLLDSVRITAWDVDYDASFWSGTGEFSPSGMSLADLGAPTDSNYNGGDAYGDMRWVDVSSGGAADWLFFGASSSNSDGKKDRMKIKLMTVERRVPAPPTLALLLLGLAGLANRRRRTS